MENSNTIERFNELKQKEQSLSLKKVELETKLKDLEEKLDDSMSKVKELGFNSEEELKAAYEKEAPEIEKQLKEAFEQLDAIDLLQ